jgi:hypothetical protein
MVEGRREDETDWWSFVRKEDGTYWQIAVTDLFPPTGGVMKVTPGAQITDSKTVASCESLYKKLQKKISEEPSK